MLKKKHTANYLYGKYFISYFLVLAALFIFGCTTSGPSKRQVADVMQTFIQSDDNPLVNSYEKYDYQLEKSDTSDKEYYALYKLTEKSKLSEVILSLSTEWHKYDQGWEIVDIEIDDRLARPLNGPTNDEMSEAVFTILPSIYQSSAQTIKMLSQDWNIGDDIIQVEFSMSSEFSTFTDITENSLEMKWDLVDEQWIYSKCVSFQEQIDFKGINGTWEGLYDQYSVAFKISDAGTFICSDDGGSDLTFILNHNLNDVGIDAKTEDFAISVSDNGFLIDLAKGFESSALLIGTDGLSFEIDGKSIPLSRVSDVEFKTASQAYLEDTHMTSNFDTNGAPVDSITNVSPTGTWYVSSILRDTQANTIIHYVWYDTNGDIITTYDLNPQGAKDIYICGSFELTSSAPSGLYRVDIFVDDASLPAATVDFTVE